MRGVGCGVSFGGLFSRGSLFSFEDFGGHYPFGANEIRKDDERERNEVASRYRLFQIEFVDNEDERELSYYEKECILRWGNEFVFVSDINCPRHEEPICPSKRYGFGERLNHGHVGEF
jgi:hypothetical protein